MSWRKSWRLPSKKWNFLFPIGLLRFLLLLFGRSLILWSRLDCTRIHYIAQTGLKLTATPLPLSLEFRDCKHDPPWLPTDVLRLTDFELCHSKCGNLRVTFGGLASKCTTAFTAQRKRFWKAVWKLQQHQKQVGDRQIRHVERAGYRVFSGYWEVCKGMGVMEGREVVALVKTTCRKGLEQLRVLTPF